MSHLAPRNWLPVGLRRRMRRFEARLRGESAVMVYGNGYQHALPGVPIDGLRGERILAALAREGLIGREAVLRPGLVPLAKLERVHDRGYLERLRDPSVMESTFGLTLERDLAERVVELQRFMTGGTILAARAAWRERKLAVNLGGGFHHGQRDRGRGFCLINDIAVAIAELRSGGMDQPIAVIDLDLHDGDGTRSLFAKDPSVWTFSLHNEHWGPTEASPGGPRALGGGEAQKTVVSSTAIALGSEIGDDEYLAALREHLPSMLDLHRPRLVIVQAGCDGAAGDPLGNWQISDAGMLARDRYVFEQLHARGIRSIVWLLGGGYGNDAWRLTARTLISVLGGPSQPRLPSTEALTLVRYRHLAQVIDPRDLSGIAPGELSFDESDLFGVSPHIDRTRERVLGYYTKTGVEFAFERYGLLPRLRSLGFEPRVEIDCGGETGDTVRIFGDEGNELLLVEIRVARDRQTVTGRELLRIEWMLLQNPRASWVAGRAPLPGQRHPGLRLFEEVALLMLIVCERLGLAGIVVVPSHYHVAARWHGRMRFLDPVREGRFRALNRVLAPLSLREASQAVELGRVTEVGSSARPYEPAALILPASEELVRRFDDAWERAAKEAETATRFELH
jgi:acetoin utilization deacetylase AcuC-like enzyme